MGERLLAIDTATIACSVALFEDGALIASDYAEIGRGHAEKLIPAIAQLPDRGKADQRHTRRRTHPCLYPPRARRIQQGPDAGRGAYPESRSA